MTETGPLRRFSLRSFLLTVICIGLVVGMTGRVVVSITARNAARIAAIDAISAEKNGSAWMFSSDGPEVTSSRDPSPVKVMLMHMDPQPLAENLQHCAAIGSVVELFLADSSFDPAFLMSVDMTPHVRIISCQLCKGLTEQVCSILVKKYPFLEEIDLQNSDIGRNGLEEFSELKYLTSVDVSDVAIASEDIAHTFQSFPALERLTIGGEDLRGKLRHFGSLPQVREITLKEIDFTEEDLAGFLDQTRCDKVVALSVFQHLNRDKIAELLKDKAKLDILEDGIKRF